MNKEKIELSRPEDGNIRISKGEKEIGELSLLGSLETENTPSKDEGIIRIYSLRLFSSSINSNVLFIERKDGTFYTARVAAYDPLATIEDIIRGVINLAE